MSPSYPPLVAVPKDIDDETLRKLAPFRHSGRFPVLSYYHRKNGMVCVFFLCIILEYTIIMTRLSPARS